MRRLGFPYARYENARNTFTNGTINEHLERAFKYTIDERWKMLILTINEEKNFYTIHAKIYKYKENMSGKKEIMILPQRSDFIRVG